MGVMMPIGGPLFVYASPIPLFVMALIFGLRPLALSSLVALIGISCVGSIGLSLHFMLSVSGGVLWYSYVRSLSREKSGQKIVMGWVLLGLTTVVLTTSEAGFIDQLTKAVDIFYKDVLPGSQLAELAPDRESLLRVVRIMPALLAIIWLGAMSLSLMAANWFVRTRLGMDFKPIQLYTSLSEGCLYLMLIAVLGCLLEDPGMKLFFVNALVFSLFPFMNLGNNQIVKKLKAMPSGQLWLITFYVLCFLMLWPLILMVFMGIGTFLKTYRLPFKHHNISNS